MSLSYSLLITYKCAWTSGRSGLQQDNRQNFKSTAGSCVMSLRCRWTLRALTRARFNFDYQIYELIFMQKKQPQCTILITARWTRKTPEGKKAAMWPAIWPATWPAQSHRHRLSFNTLFICIVFSGRHTQYPPRQEQLIALPSTNPKPNPNPTTGRWNESKQ